MILNPLTRQEDAADAGSVRSAHHLLAGPSAGSFLGVPVRSFSVEFPLCLG